MFSSVRQIIRETAPVSKNVFACAHVSVGVCACLRVREGKREREIQKVRERERTTANTSR